MSNDGAGVANNHTEIVCVIDESGSMGSLQQQTIDGFNKFLEEQRRAPGTANLTLVQFNTGWRTPIKSTSVNLVPQLDRNAYRPTGGTALLDALGHAMETIGNVVSGVQGADVVFVIITDGQENSSTDYKRGQIKEMIEEREAKGWKFIYLGANQDAFAEAGAMGVAQTLTANYTAGNVGSAHAYSSDTITQLRSAKASGTTLSTADLEKIKMKWKKDLEGETKDSA